MRSAGQNPFPEQQSGWPTWSAIISRVTPAVSDQRGATLARSYQRVNRCGQRHLIVSAFGPRRPLIWLRRVSLILANIFRPGLALNTPHVAMRAGTRVERVRDRCGASPAVLGSPVAPHPPATPCHPSVSSLEDPPVSRDPGSSSPPGDPVSPPGSIPPGASEGTREPPADAGDALGSTPQSHRNRRAEQTCPLY